MENDHIARQFDADLENIRNRIMQMGGLVEQQFVRAMEGFTTGNMDLIEATLAAEKLVNQQETELDEACNKIIARRQPTAADLRLIVSVIKTVTDLERIGDEAKKIAKKARKLMNANVANPPVPDLHHVTELVVDMLRRSLDAFARIDTLAAVEVVRMDSEVDAEYKTVLTHLILHIGQDNSAVQQCIEQIFIAKAIERIADHTTNIAEHVVYMAKGRDVRHIGLAGIEKEIAAD